MRRNKQRSLLKDFGISPIFFLYRNFLFSNFRLLVYLRYFGFQLPCPRAQRQEQGSVCSFVRYYDRQANRSTNGRTGGKLHFQNNLTTIIMYVVLLSILEIEAKKERSQYDYCLCYLPSDGETGQYHQTLSNSI